MRDKLHEMQDAYPAESCKVTGFVIEVVELAASVGSARMEKAALE